MSERSFTVGPMIGAFVLMRKALAVVMGVAGPDQVCDTSTSVPYARDMPNLMKKRRDDGLLLAPTSPDERRGRGLEETVRRAADGRADIRAK